MTAQTTAHTITDAQIEALRYEAALAHDMEMFSICSSALGIKTVDRMDREEARAECARVIADAEAQDDSE